MQKTASSPKIAAILYGIEIAFPLALFVSSFFFLAHLEETSPELIFDTVTTKPRENAFFFLVIFFGFVIPVLFYDFLKRKVSSTPLFWFLVLSYLYLLNLSVQQNFSDPIDSKNYESIDYLSILTLFFFVLLKPYLLKLEFHLKSKLWKNKTK